jgi:hypothetical protein
LQQGTGLEQAIADVRRGSRLDGIHPPHDVLTRGVCDRGEFGVNHSDGIKRDQGEPILGLQLTQQTTHRLFRIGQPILRRHRATAVEHHYGVAGFNARGRERCCGCGNAQVKVHDPVATLHEVRLG